MMRRLLTSCLAAAFLAGCASTPPPGLKPGDVPAAFDQKAAVNAPVWPARDWWKNYNDPQLAALMDQAQANNLDIAQAAARLRQADARARQAGAALLPQVGAGANVSTLYGQANGTSLHETDYNAGLNVSYELDFWGRNRDLLDVRQGAAPCRRGRSRHGGADCHLRGCRPRISSYCRCANAWRWRGPT